ECATLYEDSAGGVEDRTARRGHLDGRHLLLARARAPLLRLAELHPRGTPDHAMANRTKAPCTAPTRLTRITGGLGPVSGAAGTSRGSPEGSASRVGTRRC